MHNDTRLSLNEPFTLYGTYFEVTYNTIDNDHSSMGMKLHYNARLINQSLLFELNEFERVTIELLVQNVSSCTI